MNPAMGLLALALGQIAPPESVFDQDGKRAGYLAKPTLIERASRFVGAAAPAFRAADTHGKVADSKTLFKKPTLLLFIEDGCPCCAYGKVYFDRLQRLFRLEANVLGLVYGDRARANAWAKANRPAFRIAADPKGKIAESYRAEVGLAVRLIAPNGKIAISTPGYSVSVLEQVASQIVKLTKRKPRKIETKPAPEAMASGCPLGSHEG